VALSPSVRQRPMSESPQRTGRLSATEVLGAATNLFARQRDGERSKQQERQQSAADPIAPLNNYLDTLQELIELTNDHLSAGRMPTLRTAPPKPSKSYIERGPRRAGGAHGQRRRNVILKRQRLHRVEQRLHRLLLHCTPGPCGNGGDLQARAHSHKLGRNGALRKEMGRKCAWHIPVPSIKAR
jgi:hypothetical protein